MKENKFRFLKGGAVAALVGLTAISPVFAADSDLGSSGTSWSTIETADNSVPVTYDVEATYTVDIPKSLVLDKTTKSVDYTVTVNGDMTSDYRVNVTPTSTFLMSDANGKADVTATVTQNKTTWTYSEMNTSTTGNVSATNLTAGNWTGSLVFTITLENYS